MDGYRPAIRAVVFDFDGTLAELVLDFGLMKRRVAEAAAPYLASVPPADGLPALEYASRLAQGMAPGQGRSFLDAVAGHIRDLEIEAAARARLFPQTLPTLAALARRGIRRGIITRNCRAAVDTIFPDAARHVEVVLTRDEARHVKPDPRHLLDALALLDVPAQAALMVGDHPMDVATGKAAGTLTAGVASGRVSLDELGRVGADYLARDLGELLRMLGWEEASGGRGG